MPVDPKEKEEAKRQATECIGTDEGDCGTGAIVLLQALCEAEAEAKRLKTCSTIEVMCENPSVDSHVREWEARCLKAEADLAKSREECARKDEALEQYSRQDFYLFLLDPIGQKTDPTKKAREALSHDPSWLARHDAEKDAEIERLRGRGIPIAEADSLRKQVRDYSFIYDRDVKYWKDLYEEAARKEQLSYDMLGVHVTNTLQERIRELEDRLHAFVDAVNGYRRHNEYTPTANGITESEQQEKLKSSYTKLCRLSDRETPNCGGEEKLAKAGGREG